MTGDTQLTLTGLVLLIGCAAGGIVATHTVTNCTTSILFCPPVSLSCSHGKLGIGHMQHQDRDQKKCNSVSLQQSMSYIGRCLGRPNCTMHLSGGCYRCPCVSVAYNCSGETTTTPASTTPTIVVTNATDMPSQATKAADRLTINRNAPSRNGSINLYAYIGIGVGVFVVMSIVVAIACRQLRKQGDDNSGDASSGNSESYEAVDATLNKATETGTEAGQKKPGN